MVRVLPGFERDMLRGRLRRVQMLIDGTNSNTASLVSSYATAIVAGFASEAGAAGAAAEAADGRAGRPSA